MKKVILSLLALVAMANAGMWSVVTGPKKILQPTAAYTIETPGYNPRIYEWTTSEGYKCLAMMASSNDASSPAIFCFNPNPPKRK